MSQVKRRMAASFAATVATLVLAGGALASAPQVVLKNDRISGDFVDTETCPGVTVLTAFEIKRSRSIFVDAEGNPLREVTHAIYTITWTNVDDPTRVVRSPGTRYVVVDYVAGTFSDTGVYRNATARGEGNVLHQSGRLVDRNGTLLALNGPHEDLEGLLGDFCAALGG